MAFFREPMCGNGLGQVPCDRVPDHSNEYVNIPHFSYVQHTQPIERNWTTEEVKYDRVPVMQDTRQMQHPTVRTCNNGVGMMGMGGCGDRVGMMRGWY
jgi:hypothetical protein